MATAIAAASQRVLSTIIAKKLRQSTIKSHRPIQTCLRSISTTSTILQNEATAPSSSSSSTEIKPFNSPQVEALYHKLITLPPEDLDKIGDLMAEKCGITLSPYDLGLIDAPPTTTSTQQDEEEEEEAVQEKNTFDIKLTSYESKSKIKVIKEVRSIFGLGLKEAKELVDNVPKVLKKDVKKEEVEELRGKLEAVGGTVELL